MAINLNVNPYYDDYDEDKGFHRILFKPGVSVQARELTQLQTILAKQVERIGKHFFEDGAMVIPGQIAIDTKVKAIKLDVASVGTTDLSATFNGLNLTIEGLTTGVEAVVLIGINAEGSDPPTLIVRFTKTGTNYVTQEFSAAETIRIKSTSTSFLTSATTPVYSSSIASIQEGVYFAAKQFVKVTAQTIPLEKYTNTPTYRVGLAVSEEIITEVDDSSLYDNAIGSPNEAAPGADRYKVSLTLSKLTTTSELDQDFFELARVNDGIVTKMVNKTDYSILEKTMARRTFDESGNYTVNPFRIQIREHRNNNRGAWAATTAYETGDIVTYSGNTYVALSTASSSTTPPTHDFGAVTNGVKWQQTSSPDYNLGVYTPANGGDSTKIAVGVEPGKAYVQGYEVEKIATDFVSLSKARDLEAISNDVVTTIIGNYILVSNVNCSSTTSFVVSNFTSVDLYDRFTTVGQTASGSKIGTAKIRAIDYDSGNAALANAVFKLSLFDINLDVNKTLERNVKQLYNTNFTVDIAGYNSDYVQLSGVINAAASTSITGSGTAFTSELVAGDYIYFNTPTQTRVRVSSITNDYSLTVDAAVTVTNSNFWRAQTKLKDAGYVPAMFELPYSFIKGTYGQQFTLAKQFTGTSDGSGVLTISMAGTDTVVQSAGLSQYVILNRTAGNTAAGAAITYPSSTQFSISGLAASTDFSVIAPVSTTETFKSKTATTDILAVTNNVLYSANEISLNKTDVYKIDGIRMVTSTGNVDITGWYDLDTGQRSTHYDVAKIIRKPNYPAPSSNVFVSYRYYAHGTGSNYFSANSYPSYDEIPVFYGDNFVVRLSDVLDFRPVKNDNGIGFKSSALPKRGYTSTLSYQHYLARNDKISIDFRGNLFTTQGASATIAQDPNDPTVGMTLYKINLQPYTARAKSPDVTFEYIDNKRFTMRDIGSIEKRLQNVEYYTALSLLEQDTSSLSLKDAYGLERFKNGFIVDNFEGHGVGDVTSSDYRCAINMENNELRPFYSMDNINLVEKNTTTADRTASNYQVTGDLVTLKYTHSALVDQPYASRAENVNPFAIAAFNGQVTLTPSSDEWFETDTRPEIIVNEEGNFDAVATALESSGALGTIWNAWQTQWTGTPVNGDVRSETAILQRGVGVDFDQRFGVGAQQVPWAGPGGRQGVGVRTIALQTQSTQVGQARTGVRTSVVARIDRRVVDDRILSTATIPFIRSRRVAILGRGFKPNTQLYGYFDDVAVSSYITPASTVTATMGTTTPFDYLTNADTYGAETDRAARRVSGNQEPAFNRGDIVYVSTRSSTPYTLTTSPATAVLGYSTPGNVLHLINIQGSFASGDTITGTISGATATISASVTAAAQGDALITNSAGDVVGVFNIPNTGSVRFRTGSRELKLIDSSTNSVANSTTVGRVIYSATGMLQTRQATIAATRNAELVREAVSETNVVTETSERVAGDTGWYDPLAQTFLVDKKNGCFLTKIDLFFSAKDSNLPVTIEIRNTVNGYPGKRVLPFSRTVLAPSEVQTSSDASVATTVTFRSPVYVEEDGEYCIVLLSDSVNYRVWISQLGEDMVGTDRKISAQPYAGVLFKSQNASTWTADQLQDLKFKLYRAVFDTSSTGVVSFVNESIPTRVLPYNSLKLINASPVVTVIHPGHGMQSGNLVTLSGYDTVVGNVKLSDINKTHTISNVLIDSYTITVGNAANATTVVTSSNIRATEDIVFDVMQPIVQYQTFSGTSIAFTANTTPATTATRATLPISVTANENNYLTTPQAIRGNTNEVGSGTARKTFELRAAIASNLDSVSPVIDLNRTSLITISNQIDDISSNVANFAHNNKNIITANTQIRFSGNTISTNNPDVANVIATVTPGKTVVITGASTPANNASAVVSEVLLQNGIANVSFYYSFTTESVGGPVTLVQKDGFIDERAYTGGSAASKYITRQINLQNPSKYLRIMFSANVPKNANIDVYYRTLAQGSNKALNTTNFTLLNPITDIVKTNDPGLFTDVMYEADNLPAFTAIAIKIVFRSSNSSDIPSVKDLRVVACP